MKKKCCCVLLFCAFLGLTGCTGVGKMVLPPDRYGLNESLHLSQNQQILLNIVRLRYSDAPYFLGVGSVTSSYSLYYGASGYADYTKENGTNENRNRWTREDGYADCKAPPQAQI